MSTLAPKGVKKKAALPGAISAQVAIFLKAFCQLDSVSLLRQCLLAGSPSTQPAHSKNVWLKRPWMFSRRRPSTNQSHARGCFAWKKYRVSWVLQCWCMRVALVWGLHQYVRLPFPGPHALLTPDFHK